MSQLISHHLQNRVNQIYDHLYANSAVRTPAGIATEVGKILHVGMFIEEVDGKRPAYKFDRIKLRSLLGQDSDLCEEIAKPIRQDFRRMNAKWKLYSKADSTLLLSDLDLGYVVGKLDDVYLSDPSRDVFGDVVEIIRSNWAKRIGGQFFTDQRVTSLAMTLLDFDPRRGDDIVDLCAGTGGFLLAAVNHTRSLLETGNAEISVEEELVKLVAKSILGAEVDAEVASLGNASLITRLGNLPRPIITHRDSLRISADPSNGIGFGKHICAASNPPFGATITIKDPSILSQFELAQTKQMSGDLFSFSAGKLSPRAPDVLFLEQNLNLLKPGVGRLAIVLPYQILSGPQTLYVRDWLLRNAKLLAIVDLPSETFQPHTGTKTSLLLVQRRETPLNSVNDDDKGTVFMSMPKWIGHDRRGNPIFCREEDGTETDEILSDFPKVKNAYKAFVSGGSIESEHPQSFAVPYSRIVADPLLRANALFHKPTAARASSSGLGGVGLGKEWETVKVRDVVDRIFYPGRFRRDYVEKKPGTVAFLGGANITELIVTTDKWLREDDPKLAALTVRAGWILITRSGSTGIISSVPQAWDGFAMSEHVIRIVPDAKKLNPYFLMAMLRTDYVQEVLKRGVFGSVIDEITPEFIGDIEIPIPPKGELNRLVRVVQEAEEARQVAIDGITSTVLRLNDAMSTL